MQRPPFDDVIPPDSLSNPKPAHPGDWIRHHREALGYTRHRLAVVADVELVALKRIETRPYWPYSIETARRLIAVILELEPKAAATAPRMDSESR